jgi:hypothetical protein
MRFLPLVVALTGAALLAPAAAGAASAPTTVAFNTTHRGYAVRVVLAETGSATGRVRVVVTARKKVAGAIAEHRYTWLAPGNGLRVSASGATVAIDGVKLSLTASSPPRLLPADEGCTGYAGLYRPARARGNVHLAVPDLGMINASDPAGAQILPVGPGRQRCLGPGTCARPTARGRVEVDLGRIVDGETRTLSVLRGRRGRPFLYVFIADRPGRGSEPHATDTLTVKSRRGPVAWMSGKGPGRLVLRGPGHGIAGSIRFRGAKQVSEDLYPCRHLHVRWFEGPISGGITVRVPDLTPRVLRPPAHGSYRTITR